MSPKRPNETESGYSMRLVENIYDMVEHGKMIPAANLLTQTRLSAMRHAADLIDTYEAHRIIGNECAKIEKEL